MKILGVSGSLRNARYGRGSALLVDEIKALGSREELLNYLKKQTKIRVDEFLEAGREGSRPFDELYRNLQKARGEKGLSNSEAALVAGLWGAVGEGAEIQHAGLSRYFPMNGKSRHLVELKSIILEADALLVSGPVYFGDRGSLVQSFVELISADSELREHVKGRVYAGIAVGAKRNGGQETQLVYQIIDMCNLNMLAVGNSAETTSQYGGTVLAGDVGTAWSDEYGLDTSIGTGQRLARVALGMEQAARFKIVDKVKIGVWLVQDDNNSKGRNYISTMLASCNVPGVEFEVMDLTQEEIYRCIACDLCPTHHAPRDEYACIIKSPEDAFVKHHQRFMEFDAILLAAYSPSDRSTINSVYQQFIERTRYIRRSNYMIGDRLVAPFVVSEMNSNQNLHIRMLTSLIRHHMTLHHPIIGFEQGNKVINSEFVSLQLDSFAMCAVEHTKARLSQELKDLDTEYQPVGYHISQERNNKDAKDGRLSIILSDKESSFLAEQAERLVVLEKG